MTTMTMRPETGDRHLVEWTLLALPSSVGLLRDYASAVLTKWGLEAMLDDVKLIVSELATNAASPKVAYGRDITFRLALLRTGLILIEVTDPSPAKPEPRQAADTDIHGRGLFIVQHLADGFGHRDEPDGRKTVWATLTAQTESSKTESK